MTMIVTDDEGRVWFSAGPKLKAKFEKMAAWVAVNPGLPKRRLLDQFYKSTPGTNNGITSGYRAIRRAIGLGYFQALRVGSSELLYPIGALDAQPIVCNCTGDCATCYELARACFRAGPPKARFT